MYEFFMFATKIDQVTSLSLLKEKIPYTEINQLLAISNNLESRIAGDLLYHFVQSRVSALEGKTSQMVTEREELIQLWEKYGEHLTLNYTTSQSDFFAMMDKIPIINQPTGFPTWLMRKIPITIIN